MEHKFLAACVHSISSAGRSAVASYNLAYSLAYRTMAATTASSMCQCDTPLPEVLLLVSPNFQQWVLEGPARPYHKVMLTVHVTDSVSTVSNIAACITDPSHQQITLYMPFNRSAEEVHLGVRSKVCVTMV
jgi:hypothetical protein